MGSSVTAMAYADAIEQCRTGREAWLRGGTTTTCWSHRRAPSSRCSSASSRRPTPIPASWCAWATLVGFMIPFDVTGQPAISLPLHWFGDGLPDRRATRRGVRARRRVARVAAQLEQARRGQIGIRPCGKAVGGPSLSAMIIDASAQTATTKPINMYVTVRTAAPEPDRPGRSRAASARDASLRRRTSANA